MCRPVAEVEPPTQQFDRAGWAGATPRRPGEQILGWPPLSVVVQIPALVISGAQSDEQRSLAVVQYQPPSKLLARRRLEPEGMFLVVNLHAEALRRRMSKFSHDPGFEGPSATLPGSASFILPQKTIEHYAGNVLPETTPPPGEVEFALP